jgi:hypothetical protein
MLTEIEGTRQIPGEGIRRWFRDDELDLIVWYGDDGSIEGFQLCYDKLDRERALTFRKPDSYQHHAIDTGESAMLGPKMTPVLVADGAVDSKRIERVFSKRCANVPKDLAEYVSEMVLAYPGA